MGWHAWLSVRNDPAEGLASTRYLQLTGEHGALGRDSQPPPSRPPQGCAGEATLPLTTGVDETDPVVQDTLTKHEKDGTTDSKEYQDAMEVFYARHVCRLNPMPKDVTDTFAELAKDPTVYYTM